MKTLYYRLSSAALLASLIVAPFASAKNKPKTADPKDQIEVVGHIAQTNGPVLRFLSTQHYSSYYLYAEHQAGGKATLIDVTKTSQPAVLGDVAYAPTSTSDSLTVVAGTAALVSNEPANPAAAPAPQAIRIMDFSDPQNPKVSREFTGVTAMTRDNQRGLIFVANADGIWILEQHFAQDPEVQRAYEDYVIYGPSMYGPRK